MTDDHRNNGEVEKTGQQRLGTLVYVVMSLLSGGSQVEMGKDGGNCSSFEDVELKGSC